MAHSKDPMKAHEWGYQWDFEMEQWMESVTGVMMESLSENL